MSEYFGKETPKLGFGMMRLPREGEEIDIPQTSQMVDCFLEAGFTYFDTAFVYEGSEEATQKALVDRYPRDRFTLATKLNAHNQAPTEEAAKQQFYTSLERTGAGYFDYYLLHAIMEKNYASFDDFHIWDFVKEQKNKGLIKHLGFSFHDGPEMLDRILTAHPEMEFVQLQINYADWENPTVASRANYEMARKHGKSIVVMEPVKGGKLATPPEEVQKLMKACHPDWSYASWAIRFVASLDGLITVLSGMSNLEQMEDNLSYMTNFEPLNEEEQNVIRQAQHILAQAGTIPCTNCRYCVEGCPMQIPIPAIFSAMNKQLSGSKHEEAVRDYDKVAEAGHRASDCIGCKQCERACPQHLPIVENLKQCAEALEG